MPGTNHLHVMQGDQYALNIRLTCDGKALTSDMVKRIEFSILNMLKYFPDEVSYVDDGTYAFPLTQEETFALQASPFSGQARVYFSGSSDIIGVPLQCIDVERSLSKVVL